jgi:hypothetical protein
VIGPGEANQEAILNAFQSDDVVQYFDANTGPQRRMDYAPDVNGKPTSACQGAAHA